MEIGEGLIESRAAGGAGGVELVIRATHDRTCFVALPRHVAASLAAADPPLPLPLALVPRETGVGGAIGGAIGGADRRGVAADRRSGAADGRSSLSSGASTPPFAAWAGAVSAGHELEVPLALADCLGVREGDVVRVMGRATAPVATAVEVAPEAEEDWRAVLAAAAEMETGLLRQVGVAAEGQTFPFWSADRAEGAGPLRLRATAVTPRAPGGVARLGLETELRVAPWVPDVAGTAKSGPSPAANASATPLGTLSEDDASRDEKREEDDEDASAILPAVLRVQSTRGAVAMWPRRLRGVDPAPTGVAEMSASPTSCAFISRATARARGLRDGDVVVLAAVGVASSGVLKRDAPKSPSATVRVVALPGNAAAAGHVALPPATRERLGVTQGDRVAAIPAAARRPREEGEGGTLVRLKPVASRSEGGGGGRESEGGGGGSESEGGGGGSESVAAADTAAADTAAAGSTRAAAALEPAHLAALGQSRSDGARDGDEREGVGDRFDAAARGLLARWVATQSRFRAPPDSNANGDGDGDGDDSRPGKATPKVVVPAATGSTMDVRVVGVDGATSTARFELDVRAPGGVAALTPELFTEREDFSHRAPRVEMSSTVTTAPVVPSLSPASKLFGRAVSVDPFLGADASLDAVAPPGSSAAAVVADAVARLVRALRSIPGEAFSASSRASSRFRTGTRFPRPPRPGGALLWGASGCGKTAAARAVARRLRDNPDTLACVVTVDCGTLPRGDSRAAAAAFRAAATAASRRAPAVIVLDDVDAVAAAAAADAGAAAAAGAPTPGSTVGEILSDLMDATSARGAPRVAWLATAASPESLAPATRLAGRLDFDGEIRAPERAGGREALVAAVADARGTPVAPGAARAAAKRAEGFAAGDLRAYVERAAHAAAAERLRGGSAESAESSGSGSGSASLRARDFVEARSGLTSTATRALGARARGGVDGNSSPGSASLDAVGGLAEVKAALDEALSLPSRHASLFADAPLRLRTGALLYGPPGCGKTMVALAAVAAAGLRCVSVKGPELLNKYIGQSEAGVRDVFRRAAAAAPCALFFDEFDAIAPRRGHDSTGVTDRVVNQFLTELDGVEGLAGVTVLAATSRPDLIDPALLRPGRLDRLLLCPFPNRRDRRDVLRVAAGIPTGAEGDARARETGVDDVADGAEGFSGADLRAVVADANLFAIHRAMEEEKKRAEEDGDASGAGRGASPSDPRPTREDYARAAASARASVPARERARLEAVYASFRGGRAEARGAGSERGGKRVSHA